MGKEKMPAAGLQVLMLWSTGRLPLDDCAWTNSRQSEIVLSAQPTDPNFLVR
jgi:hypothetical protein